MNAQAQKLVEKLNKVYVDRDELNQICKDRLDFGFDSIYFRYAEVCDELAAYKSMYDHVPAVEARRRMDHKKMHFYNALEQLVHAHEQQEDI